MTKEMTIEERMKEENAVREKDDEKGNKWRKLHFGGAHFRNWLEQCNEIYGEEDVEVEEVNSTGFKCFEEGGEKIYRIRIREEEA